jgi:pantoate--beta-alanine ligase
MRNTVFDRTHALQIISTIAGLRSALAGQTDVCLVPTMGNLHAGHLSLVKLARERHKRVVASIFVNPLQFAPNEDFATYPRTLDQDCELLASGGCDVVFAPTPQEMYPQAQTYTVTPPASLADTLEGAFRPGFFTGVCTVVLKLFNIVQPRAAVFGKKDYQQLLVIENMVRELCLPIDILRGETIRTPEGLALSSRNGYLNEAERKEATQLSAALSMVAGELRSGLADHPQIERVALESLSRRGWRPDYIAVRRRTDLGLPTSEAELVVLGAAKIGETRLIDNLEF